MEINATAHIEDTTATLQSQIKELVAQLQLSDAKVAELQVDILYYKHELDKLKKMIYGSRSERFIPQDQDQVQLTLGMDIPQIEALPAPQKETVTITRNISQKKEKKHPIRMVLPADLPRKEFIIEPEQDLTGAKKIGEIITEVLDYEPGKLFVNKYIRPKYIIPQAEQPIANQINTKSIIEDSSTQEPHTTIITGELPSMVIPKGNAGAGLLAHIIVDKYADHLPFYRQVQRFKREGADLKESTIHGWFSETCSLLAPLNDKLKLLVQGSNYLGADETPIPVQSSEKPGSTHTGYLWVYRSTPNKLVYFDYQKGRSREGPEEFLKDYQGALQTDGYTAYDIFETKPGITLLACMAHVRRKFDESLNNDPFRAGHALTKIQELYLIERLADETGLDHNQRKIIREEKALPILKELEQWLKDQLNQVLPKSVIGGAIHYSLNMWKRLVRYVEDGRYRIDNNLVENSIRPVALGRKNYMFAGSHQAAERAAMIYSFLGTCKLHEVNPFEWLRDVLIRIPDYKVNRLEELLPHKWKENH